MEWANHFVVAFLEFPEACVLKGNLLSQALTGSMCTTETRQGLMVTMKQKSVEVGYGGAPLFSGKAG